MSSEQLPSPEEFDAASYRKIHMGEMFGRVTERAANEDAISASLHEHPEILIIAEHKIISNFERSGVTQAAQIRNALIYLEHENHPGGANLHTVHDIFAKEQNFSERSSDKKWYQANMDVLKITALTAFALAVDKLQGDSSIVEESLSKAQEIIEFSRDLGAESEAALRICFGSIRWHLENKIDPGRAQNKLFTYPDLDY